MTNNSNADDLGTSPMDAAQQVAEAVSRPTMVFSLQGDAVGIQMVPDGSLWTNAELMTIREAAIDITKRLEKREGDAPATGLVIPEQGLVTP